MPNKTISVPKHLQANRSKSIVKIASLILKYFNWSIRGAIPSDKRVVVVVGPHTSNWDFIIGVLVILSLDVRINWIGKHTIFKNGFKNFLKSLHTYGFLVIRNCETNLKCVEKIANKIGYVRNSIFGGLWSFESDENKADSAYTQEELRPHTD